MLSGDDGLKFYFVTNSKHGVMGVAHVKPFFRGPIHFHPQEETYHMLKGRGILSLNDGLFELREGQSITIKPNCKHALVSVRGCVLMFKFDTGPFDTIDYHYTGGYVT